MTIRILFLFFFAITYSSAYAQTERVLVHHNDSSQIYFFNLFDEERAMSWGTIPKNFPFFNYRVYLRNNSLDTLKVGRVTTGDGRVTYDYSGRTRIIYPDEFVVLTPMNNGTQIRHRVGSFNKQVQISLHTADTIYHAYHRYVGQFSNDTVLPHFTRNDLVEQLLPLRKPEELKQDSMLVAQTNAKLEAMGKKKVEFINQLFFDQ